MDPRASKRRKTTSSASRLPPLPPILSPDLASAAFTHQAIADASNTPEQTSYERLEFLGDAYLQIISSRLIYSHFPVMTEGGMSQMRESMVKNETLAEYSLGYGFDKRAKLPSDLWVEGLGRKKLWVKTMGDIFEAYVAAVILSDPKDGLTLVETWLTELWAPKLVDHGSNQERLNELAKQELAQKIMSKGIVIDYRPETDFAAARKEVKAIFEMGVYLTGWDFVGERLGRGKGFSVKEAGTRAAMQALSNEITIEVAGRKRAFDATMRAEREREALTVKRIDDERRDDAGKTKKDDVVNEKKRKG